MMLQIPGRKLVAPGGIPNLGPLLIIEPWYCEAMISAPNQNDIASDELYSNFELNQPYDISMAPTSSLMASKTISPLTNLGSY